MMENGKARPQIFKPTILLPISTIVLKGKKRLPLTIVMGLIMIEKDFDLKEETSLPVNFMIMMTKFKVIHGRQIGV
jgi:hypothetical protein